MFKIIMVVLVGAAFFLSWYASDIRRLTRDYGTMAPFDGPVVEALVRFALADYRAHCSVGANSQGLYIAPSAAAGKINSFSRWWHPGYHILKTPILLPWTALQYHPARLPFGAQVRFDVPSLRVGLSAVCFFIPRDDAEPLLASVGRQVPPG